MARGASRRAARCTDCLLPTVCPSGKVVIHVHYRFARQSLQLGDYAAHGGDGWMDRGWYCMPTDRRLPAFTHAMGHGHVATSLSLSLSSCHHDAATHQPHVMGLRLPPSSSGRICHVMSILSTHLLPRPVSIMHRALPALDLTLSIDNPSSNHSENILPCPQN